MKAIYFDLKSFIISPRLVEKDLDRLIYSDLESPSNDFNVMIILILVDIEAFEFN